MPQTVSTYSCLDEEPGIITCIVTTYMVCILVTCTVLALASVVPSADFLLQ